VPTANNRQLYPLQANLMLASPFCVGKLHPKPISGDQI
jgi:hypothetical protein